MNDGTVTLREELSRLSHTATAVPLASDRFIIIAAAERIRLLEEACQRLLDSGCSGNSYFGIAAWDKAVAQAEFLIQPSENPT